MATTERKRVREPSLTESEKDRKMRKRSHSPRRRDRSDSRERYTRRGYFYSSYDYRRYRHRLFDGRDCPEPCPILGVFGMSCYTDERELRNLFGHYGAVEKVEIVRDYRGDSRHFGFVHFGSTSEAKQAKKHMDGRSVDGCRVRVDYSVTKHGGPFRHMQTSPPRHRERERSTEKERKHSREKVDRKRSPKKEPKRQHSSDSPRHRQKRD